MHISIRFISLGFALISSCVAIAQDALIQKDSVTEIAPNPIICNAGSAQAPDTLEVSIAKECERICKYNTTLYDLPYSLTARKYDWHRLWLNTAALSGAFVGTLLVLECLPEDATSWNRAELQDVPLSKRWRNHVIDKGPEWDHDKFYFNYLLHPYAGAVYYMGARGCGFNVWQSLLYCTLISNVGWEFGIEAFMERPSIQDLFITPIVGSLIGEYFYKIKRGIVRNGYTLFGSRFFGNLIAFLIDPVNEVMGLIYGNPCRQNLKNVSLASSFMIPTKNNISFGISLSCSF